MKMQYWIVGIVGIIVSVGLGIILKRLDARGYETAEKKTRKDDK